MSSYHSGSDGYIYIDPQRGRVTGSLIKTKYLAVSGGFDDTFEEDDVILIPGVMFDVDNQDYFEYNIGHSEASYYDGSNSFNSSSMEGAIWIYGMNETSKSIIESDAEYISTLVESNL